MASFTNEVLDQLYAIQDQLQGRPVRVKPYGSTYGVSFLLLCSINGVQVSVKEYNKKKGNSLSSALKLQKVELKKERKNRKNNWKKSLRDHRR